MLLFYLSAICIYVYTTCFSTTCTFISTKGKQIVNVCIYIYIYMALSRLFHQREKQKRVSWARWQYFLLAGQLSEICFTSQATIPKQPFWPESATRKRWGQNSTIILKFIFFRRASFLLYQIYWTYQHVLQYITIYSKYCHPCQK